MKLFSIAVFSFCVVTAPLAAELSQDEVRVDLISGEITFNGEVVNCNQLSAHAEGACSIVLQFGDFSEPVVTDLFGAKDPVEPGPPRYTAPGGLISALEALAAADIEAKAVRLSAFSPRSTNATVSDQLVIGEGGEILLNDEPVDLVGLSDRLKGKHVAVAPRNREELVAYPHLLAVAKALGDDVVIAELLLIDCSSVEVSAEIYTINEAGERNMLSAPRVTTRPGSEALIRVVENGSGMKEFRSDEYHQKDLANMGIRFAVEPRIIGDHISLKGVAIITRSLGKEEVFKEGDVPMYSYTVKKTIVPFSETLSPDKKSVEFGIADIDGRPARCKLTAEIVNSHGLPKAKRKRVQGDAR